MSQETSDRIYWKFAPDLLFIARPARAGQFVYEDINPTFEALLGIASEEIRGMAVCDYMQREDARSIYAALDACLAKGAEVRLCHHLALGGSPRNVETIVAPICDPLTGTVVRLLGGHRIVSEESPEANLEQASDSHTGIAASLGVMRIRGSLSEPAKAEQLCNDIDASIDRALREIRAFAYLLHPQDLTIAGLKATIEHYAEGFAARTSLKVSARISPKVDRLPYQTQRSLLRVVQEALTNVFRHAKATGVEIAIEAVDKHFELSVSDNGRGMAVSQTICGAKTESLGVGIPAMKIRLQQIGGTLEVHSQDIGLHGTKLFAVFPRDLATGRTQLAKIRRNHKDPHKKVMNKRAGQ
jgi:anti-sigma regulatory factor (Ser/Thr protein kinase)